MVKDKKLADVWWYGPGVDDWCHRPLWKLLIDRILMRLQFWSDKPWLVASKFEVGEDGKPVRFLGYVFQRIPLQRGH